MPTPETAPAAEEKQEVDIFGDNQDPEAEAPPAKEEEGDEKKGEQEEEKGDEGGDEEEEESDDSETVEALKAANKAKDESIRNMRRRIKELEKSGGSASDAELELPYPNVKFAKDLTQDERDEMTETELKQHDVLAEMQQRINNDVKKAHEKAVKESESGDDDGDKLDKAEAKDFAKAEALKLAKGKKDVANEILAEYNRFNNEGLTEKQIVENLERANRLRPDYQPPKTQPKKKGKAVKGGSGSDPFGIDTIVEEAAGTGDKETYNL